PINRMARRYHWLSDNLKNFILEPHTGIICQSKSSGVLNMTSVDSTENKRICVDLVMGNADNLRSSVYKLTSMLAPKRLDTLDGWFVPENFFAKSILSDDNTSIDHYEMPRKL